MEEVDFEVDDFADIVSKDGRYAARGYALLMEVVHSITGDEGRHVGGDAVLDEFKEYALDQYGPLTYTVLSEWGIHCTEDIGAMMFNLVESKRLGKDVEDSPDTFIAGYDFKETFFEPYQT